MYSFLTATAPTGVLSSAKFTQSLNLVVLLRKILNLHLFVDLKESYVFLATFLED